MDRERGRRSRAARDGGQEGSKYSGKGNLGKVMGIEIKTGRSRMSYYSLHPVPPSLALVSSVTNSDLTNSLRLPPLSLRRHNAPPWSATFSDTTLPSPSPAARAPIVLTLTPWFYTLGSNVQ